MVLLTEESRKSSELLTLLDLDADVLQKTVVITRSAQEVEEVFKVQLSRCDVIQAAASLRSLRAASVLIGSPVMLERVDCPGVC